MCLRTGCTTSGKVPIRFGTYNIRNGRNGGLKAALRGMSQANMDLGILQECRLQSAVTPVTNVIGAESNRHLPTRRTSNTAAHTLLTFSSFHLPPPCSRPPPLFAVTTFVLSPPARSLRFRLRYRPRSPLFTPSRRSPRHVPYIAL